MWHGWRFPHWPTCALWMWRSRTGRFGAWPSRTGIPASRRWPERSRTSSRRSGRHHWGCRGLADRRVQLTPIVAPERLAALARGAEHLRLLRQLRPRSSMNVPLVARGRILGVITCIASESGRRYGPGGTGAGRGAGAASGGGGGQRALVSGSAGGDSGAGRVFVERVARSQEPARVRQGLCADPRRARGTRGEPREQASGGGSGEDRSGRHEDVGADRRATWIWRTWKRDDR